MDSLSDPLVSAAIAILLCLAALAGWHSIKLLRQTTKKKARVMRANLGERKRKAPRWVGLGVVEQGSVLADGSLLDLTAR